jgi:hypothetical protein
VSLRAAVGLGVVVVALATACAESADEVCQSRVDDVEACGREYNNGDPCETASLRCTVACYARLRCEQWSAVDRSEYPAWLSRCLRLCGETFVCDDGSTVPKQFACDAEHDCVDGSDERNCAYFTCDSGGFELEVLAHDAPEPLADWAGTDPDACPERSEP